MQTPRHELRLPSLTLLNEVLNQLDALCSRVQHAVEQLIPVKSVLVFGVEREIKPQVEDVLSHEVDYVAFVVADFVLEVDDALVFEV